MATKKPRRMTFDKSTDNVFADLGFANPERERLKAHLTLQIYRIIKGRGPHRQMRAQCSALSSPVFRP